MISQRLIRINCFTGIFLLTGLMSFGCVAKITTGTFRDVQQLESALKRGISTKADVKDLLGEPNGYGNSFLPVMSGQKQNPHDVWYFEDMEVKERVDSKERYSLDMRQQILIIFFDQDRYEGFMWYTNAGKGSYYMQGS